MADYKSQQIKNLLNFERDKQSILSQLTPIDVLDKGFIKLINFWGTDLEIVNAARVSFNKRQGKLEDKDLSLIDYLAKNNHWTPFGHCGFTFHFKMPIFVARQFMRSNVGIVYNEISRRYVDTKPEFYEPKWRERVTNKKQGSGEEISVDDTLAKAHVINSVEVYNSLLKQNVAPEIARAVLPVSMYTEFYATMSLMAAFRVFKLRIHPHAQKEIRDYAKGIDEYGKLVFPESWKGLLIYHKE